MALAVYPALPDTIAIHWGSSGMANGFGSKLWVFLTPILIGAMALLFAFIPKLDPYGSNVEKMGKAYDDFAVVFSAFLLMVMLQLFVLWNIGVQISPNLTFPIGIAVLFFFTGRLLKDSNRSWFVGIRTPWTLSSDEVWKKTNTLGGKLFQACAVITLIGLLVPQHSWAFIVVPVLASAIFLVVYSYLEYSKLPKKQREVKTQANAAGKLRKTKRKRNAKKTMRKK